MAFEKYQNLNTASGVTAFEIGTEQITVLFNTTAYIYNYAVTGKKHVLEMKRLAKQGKGLSTYISQNVKDKFHKKYSLKE